jgi:hypothetical protein
MDIGPIYHCTPNNPQRGQHLTENAYTYGLYGYPAFRRHVELYRMPSLHPSTITAAVVKGVPLIRFPHTPHARMGDTIGYTADFQRRALSLADSPNADGRTKTEFSGKGLRTALQARATLRGYGGAVCPNYQPYPYPAATHTGTMPVHLCSA